MCSKYGWPLRQDTHSARLRVLIPITVIISLIFGIMNVAVQVEGDGAGGAGNENVRDEWDVWSGLRYINETITIKKPTRIAPGTRVIIAPECGINVSSVLDVEGTDRSNVEFQCMGDGGLEGYWAGIFVGDEGTMIGSYLNISGARDGIAVYGGHLTITNTSIRGCERASIRVENGAVAVLGSIKIDGGNPGISVVASNVDIDSTVIMVDNATGLDVYGRSYVNVTASYILAGWMGMGVAARAGANIQFMGTTISTCDYAIYGVDSYLDISYSAIYGNNHGIYLRNSNHTMNGNTFSSPDGIGNKEYNLWSEREVRITSKKGMVNKVNVTAFNATGYLSVAMNDTPLPHVLPLLDEYIGPGAQDVEEHFPYTLVVVLPNGQSENFTLTRDMSGEIVISSSPSNGGFTPDNGGGTWGNDTEKASPSVKGIPYMPICTIVAIIVLIFFLIGVKQNK